jgi:hypothetical protein
MIQRRLKAEGKDHCEPDWTLWPGPDFERVAFKVNKAGEVTSETFKPQKGPPEEIPEHLEIAKMTVQRAPDGRTERVWDKYGKKEQTPAEIIAEVRAGLLDVRPRAPFATRPPPAKEDLLTVIFIADAHTGQRNWDQQVEANYDLSIAEHQMMAAYDEAVEFAPRADTALLAILGDYTHIDDDNQETPRGKHKLDADGRFRKVRRVATRCGNQMIEGLLEHYRTVLVQYVGGNHDPIAAGVISDYWAAWWREEPRVQVDLSDTPHRWIEFGKTMLGLTHGHLCKPSAFVDITTSRRSEMWGRTKYRYGHMGHRHKEEILLDTGGMKVITHSAITTSDKYAYGSFPLSGRTIDVSAYSRHRGHHISFQVPIEDIKHQEEEAE